MRSKFKQPTCPTRNEEGMSLASVLAVGVVTTFMVSAMFATIMPLFHSVTTMNADTRLRSISEMGVDYALAQINTGASGWDIGATPGTAATVGAATPWLTVPPSVLGPANAANAVVEVQVTAPGSAGTTNPPPASMLHDIILNQNTANNTTSTRYRMVNVRTTIPARGIQRNVRCLLQPIFGSGAASNGQYPYGVFGIASVIFAGQSAINAYNTPAGASPGFAQQAADKGTLGKISQVYGGGGYTRSIAEGGNHFEFPNPLSVYNQQFQIAGQTYNAKAATSAPWMQLYGNVYSNGGNTAYYYVPPSQAKAGGADWVYANQSYDGLPAQKPAAGSTKVATNVFGPINGIENGVWDPLATSQGSKNATIDASSGKWQGGRAGFNEVGAKGGYTYPQPEMPNPIGAPNGTQDLGAVQLKNGAKLIFSENGSPAPASINMNGGTMTIKPGDYKMSSLSVSGNSQITIDSGTQGQIANGAQPPVNIYLEGSKSATSMTVDNSSSINMSGINGKTGLNFSGNNGFANKNLTDSNQIAINQVTDIAETSGAANQFNIYSKESTNIYLQGNERVIVNAPYANVTVGSTLSNSQPQTLSKNANLYGAVLAANVYIQSSYSNGGGAFLHYDYNLHPPQRNNPWAPFRPYITNNQAECLGYRAVSWQEAVKSNVGPQVPGLPADMRWAHGY